MRPKRIDTHFHPAPLHRTIKTSENRKCSGGGVSATSKMLGGKEEREGSTIVKNKASMAVHRVQAVGNVPSGGVAGCGIPPGACAARSRQQSSIFAGLPVATPSWAPRRPTGGRCAPGGTTPTGVTAQFLQVATSHLPPPKRPRPLQLRHWCRCRQPEGLVAGLASGRRRPYAPRIARWVSLGNAMKAKQSAVTLSRQSSCIRQLPSGRTSRWQTR
jgi:hypothetical protein